MAALSYYSNWGTPFEQLNSDISAIFDPPQTEQRPPQLLLDCVNDNFVLPDDNILFDPNENDLFYFDDYCNSFPSSISPDYNNLNPIPTQPFSLEHEFEPFHCPKRQKPDFDYQEVIYSDALFNTPVPNPCFNFQDFPPLNTVTPHLPEFQTTPPVYSNGSCEQSAKKPQINGGSLSTQSIAARQRRRKITEKTRELGKLIPGAQRMNTAEMFQAAHKYITFLRAQVGILEFMGSYQQDKRETFESDELQGFVESTLVQEKLYSTEKCLVPKKFVQELRSDGEIFQSKPQVSKEIKELLPTEER